MNERCDLEAGMAKLLAARVAWAAADNGLQIHGGNVLRLNIRSVACCAMPAFSIFLKGRQKFRPILLPAASCQLNNDEIEERKTGKNHGCGQLYDPLGWRRSPPFCCGLLNMLRSGSAHCKADALARRASICDSRTGYAGIYLSGRVNLTKDS